MPPPGKPVVLAGIALRRVNARWGFVPIWKRRERRRYQAPGLPVLGAKDHRPSGSGVVATTFRTGCRELGAALVLSGAGADRNPQSSS